MIEEWDLASINLDRIKKQRYEVAVLPTSAIEPHNFHLPYGQDFFPGMPYFQALLQRGLAKMPEGGLPTGVALWRRFQSL